MPIYSYKCSSCGRVAEVIQKFSDPPPVCGDCEVLGMKCEMVRVFDGSGSSFILKGGCWERDGYSRGGKK